MNKPNPAVANAVGDSHARAGEALHRLERSERELRSISIIVSDYHAKAPLRRYLNIGDRAGLRPARRVLHRGRPGREIAGRRRIADVLPADATR